MTWHIEPNQDLESRRHMINLIANLLDRRNPLPQGSTSEAHQQKIVSAARRMEVALYKASKTKYEYMETRTLKSRISELERSGNFSLENPANRASNAPTSSSSSSANQHAEVLKQRRMRLQYLKHASKCQLAECPQSWCPGMKKLWKHVAECKVQDCTVQHCVSSHWVLSHYHRCKDKNCVVCQPVREESERKKQEEMERAQLNGELDPVSHNKRIATETPLVPTNSQIDPRFARGSKDGTGPSLPLFMTKADIILHLDSLKVEQLQTHLSPLVRKLMENLKLNGGIFNEPVDPVALNIPDYFKIIKNPMDLGTVRRRLEDGRYRKLADFEAEIRLVFDNATQFNPPEHPVHQMALQLKHQYESELRKIKQKMLEPLCPPKKGLCPLCKQETCEKCVLCERGCIPFEPKILYCAGPCAQRINRNAAFFSLPGSQISWCFECHEKKKNETTVTDISSGQHYSKLDLIKRKHDELFGEPWVCCDTCGRWCHQACALFNSRKQNPENKEEKYSCPKCLLKGDHVPKAHVPDAKDLEHTKLSCFLEMWVRQKLGVAYANEKNTKIKGDEPPSPSSVIIRVLSNYDETFPTKPIARALNANAPADLTYRSRAIFLFQHLDGVDVLLFVMYVQEYGSDSPGANAGKVYIAYLDSVHYFRPRQYRTFVYHELLLAYLEYARRSGFTSCYIWACPPPTKKDDYILHCHPEDQRVPSHERLRSWYHEMIKRGATERIVLSSCALFEEHFEHSLLKKSSTTGKRKQGSGKGKNGKSSTKLLNDKNGYDTNVIVKHEKQPYGTPFDHSTQNGETEMAVKSEFDHQMFSEIGGSDGRNGVYGDENHDDYLDDLNFENDITMDRPPTASSSTSAMNNPSLSSPPANVATPVHNKNATQIARRDDNKPLFLGLRKPDLDNLDDDDLERRRQNKLATLFKMPVFDGDYWPNEYEEVALDRARKLRGGSLVDGKKGRLKGDLTVQSLIASGEVKNLDPKALINRIGESLEQMKADFLVVKLAHECSCCGKYLLRGRWECRHPDCLQAGFNRPSPFALCDECFVREIQKTPDRQHGGESQLARPSQVTQVAQVEEDGKTIEKKENDDDETTGGSENEEKASQKEKDTWEKQPLGCTRASPEPTTSLSHQLFYVDEHLPLKTPRSDKTFKNHLLETRHAFLSLCTGNRYAFNQLRRAKHTTSMVLYHLHNPDAPAHLYSCNSCGDDIITGHRFNCALCQGGDYDLCHVCAKKTNHPHKLTRVEVTRTVDQEVSETKRKKGLEQRRQRQRSLQVFLAALVHASSCSADPVDCHEPACQKMKDLLAHRQRCVVRVRGGCEICRRVLCLVQMHARGTEQAPGCTLEHCPVPHCDDLKKHLKQKDELSQGQHATPTPKAPKTPATVSTTLKKKKEGDDLSTKKKKLSEDEDSAKKKRPASSSDGSAEKKDDGKAMKIKLKVNKDSGQNDPKRVKTSKDVETVKKT